MVKGRLAILAAVVGNIWVVLLANIHLKHTTILIDPISPFLNESDKSLPVGHVFDRSKDTERDSQDNDFPREPNPRPPLDELIHQRWNITGDINWLLNFAIVGFAKCGTTTLRHYLELSPEIQIFNTEMCHMTGNQQATLAMLSYNNFSAGAHYVRGLKCPQDIESNHLSFVAYEKFFPKTRFLIGLRHPVKWFESFYNFRVTMKTPNMRTADRLIGGCDRGSAGLCTDRANFHYHMAYLGKTNILGDPEERELMPERLVKKIKPQNHTRKIFLYDVHQLKDENQTRAEQLRKDLGAFLHLKHPLPPMIWKKPGHQELQEYSEKDRNMIEKKKIDICDDKYRQLRGVLMQQASQASDWILNYFVKSPDVTVSSLSYFDEMLQTWHKDPCDERQK